MMTAGDEIFLISATAEKPSSSGIMTSMMMMSNAFGDFRQSETASIPFSASVTVWPSNSAYFRISRRIFASSSTTRILYMIFSFRFSRRKSPQKDRRVFCRVCRKYTVNM